MGALKAAEIEWHEAWGVRPNPTLAKVKETVKAAKENSAEAILAVGGGSVLDTAKAAAAGVYVDDIWEAFEGGVTAEKALPVFAVVTLSATGSEMNNYAVITNEKKRKKWFFSSDAIFPAVSIIDPSVQTSLPWQQTANGAVDALAHVMETYFLGTSQELTLAVKEALMRTVVAMTDRLQENPGDYSARANLAWAATLALHGVSSAGISAGDFACHWISHSVSCLHPEVAHGAALAVVFPAWIQYVHSSSPAIFARWAERVWDAGSVDEAVKKMKSTFSKWGAPTSLSQLGIKEDQIKAIVENEQQMGSTGNVKKLSAEDIESLLKLAL
jgi:alcohol dehydrogenase YqhD (iron-dependent ADH family)